MKKLRTFVIPAKAGIGAKKYYKYLIGARCARFRVPIPACAGMTIFVNKNCKKYFDKFFFIKAIVFLYWGFPVWGLSTYLNASEKTINRQPLLISNCGFLFYIVGGLNMGIGQPTNFQQIIVIVSTRSPLF